jgi:hypothetical protein
MHTIKEKLDGLLGQYWDIAHSEGSTCVSRGDEAGAVLSAIQGLLAQPEGEPVATSPFTPKSIVEQCAQVCESRFRSLMADNNIVAGNEAHKCAAAVRHHGLTYPVTPITADMVTDEMVYALNRATHPASSRKEITAAAVNAYMGAK